MHREFQDMVQPLIELEENEKLQEICLHKIVTSIDRFNHAYSTSDNEVLQRGFKFLQKVYSNQLALRLGSRQVLQEKHADLIFNKHLTTLETNWLSNFSWKAIFKIFKRIGPNLESVCLKCDSRDLPLEDAIYHIPNAKKITCTSSCHNSILRCIAKCCPRLEILDVAMSVGVTDFGLQYFYRKKKGKKRSRKGECLAEKEKALLPCPLLKEIDVRVTGVGDKGIEQLLKNVPSLERIYCHNLPLVLHKMHRADLGSLDKAERYNLRHLNMFCFPPFMHNDYYDEMLEICITVCPNLESFICSVSKLEHLDLCSMLLGVKDLELSCTENSSMYVSDFLKQKFRQLTTLTLCNCTVSKSVVEECRPFLHKLEIEEDIVKMVFRR